MNDTSTTADAFPNRPIPGPADAEDAPVRPATFSVVVATCNRPHQLAECIESLVRQDYPRDSFEIIIVDDGGRDPLDTFARGIDNPPAVRVLRQPNEGPASARNRGAALARGEFLAFTDDDCRPRADWLSRLAGVLHEEEVVMAGGRTVNAVTSNVLSATSQMIVDAAYAYQNQRTPRFLASNNMALPTNTFLSLGGFDPAFCPASEDRDLCDRWLHAGLGILYVPEAIVQHAHELSITGFWRQQFAYGRGARIHLEARRRRGTASGNLDILDHCRFIRTFLSPLRQLGARRLPATLGALILWQVANLSGFCYEATVSKDTTGIRS